MKNITKQIKEAISVDALWSISDFFYFIEKLNKSGFEASYWEGEEYCATLLHDGVLIGYIWKKYPLVFIREDYGAEMMMFIKELNYIVLIESKDLVCQEFTIDRDEDLIERLNDGLDTKGFSANDFWFHTVT